MEKEPLLFVWKYIKIFKWYFLTTFVILIAGQICGQFYPYFLAKIYDTAAGKTADVNYWGDIITYTWIGFSLGLAKVLCVEATMFIWARFFPETRTLVIRDTFDYVNRHSIAYFNQEMSGNISAKVQQLDSGVTEFFGAFMNSSASVIFIIVTMAILSSISLYFMAALVIWLLLIFIAGVKLGKLRSLLSKESSEKLSKTNGMIVDSLTNYSEIKSFANFKFERLNLLKQLRSLRKTEYKEQRIKAWIHLSQNLIMVFSMLAFMFVSIALFKQRLIDTTQFIFANSLFAMLSNTIFEISWVYNNLARVYGQVHSALKTLAVPPEIVDAPQAKQLKIRQASISFENVCFAFKGKDCLFENLNLEIKAGEKVGLIGTSGAGKTTFIKLLARYFDVTSGSIKINGEDIRNFTQDSLHKHISTIPQDVCLFNRSLFDNIHYGKTNASEEQVYKAAQKASADGFIRSFPKGYQTVVGERGVVLSGGERQRIAIARAILKNAPILIFDEATSALDSESEQHIQKSLTQLMKNKTVIAIAHRLSTLREMDRILVFDKGKIVEAGTHTALLRKKGVYAKLYKMQADGFVGVTSY